MNPIVEINRIEFQVACSSYVRSQIINTSTTSGGSNVVNDPTKIRVDSPNSPINFIR